MAFDQTMGCWRKRRYTVLMEGLQALAANIHLPEAPGEESPKAASIGKQEDHKHMFHLTKPDTEHYWNPGRSVVLKTTCNTSGKNTRLESDRTGMEESPKEQPLWTPITKSDNVPISSFGQSQSTQASTVAHQISTSEDLILRSRVENRTQIDPECSHHPDVSAACFWVRGAWSAWREQAFRYICSPR